jgi:hypothetical protein
VSSFLSTLVSAEQCFTFRKRQRLFFNILLGSIVIGEGCAPPREPVSWLHWVDPWKLPTAQHCRVFTLLHISDLHVDMNEGAMRRLTELLPNLEYDACVMTGDYRGATFGVFDVAPEGMLRLRSCLRGPVYGVLGNHDTIRMGANLSHVVTTASI